MYFCSFEISPFLLLVSLGIPIPTWSPYEIWSASGHPSSWLASHLRQVSVDNHGAVTLHWFIVVSQKAGESNVWDS